MQKGENSNETAWGNWKKMIKKNHQSNWRQVMKTIWLRDLCLDRNIYKDKQIVAASQAGLANRIKCILSAKRASHATNVLWEKKGFIDCCFGDLFYDDISLALTPKDSFLLDTWKFLVYPDDNLSKDFAKKGYFTKQEDPFGRNIEFKYNLTPKKIRDVYLELIKTLTPSESVQSIVNRELEYFTENTVSVHLRTWVDDPFRHRFFDLKLCLETMNRFPGKDFFVCSDSPEIIHELKKIYGDKVRTLSNPSKKKPIRMQQTLAEMILLGQANIMLVSEESSFTEPSWYFGGCKARVYTIPSKKSKQFVMPIYSFIRKLKATRVVKKLTRVVKKTNP
jgi:hypothetical protein